MPVALSLGVTLAAKRLTTGNAEFGFVAGRAEIFYLFLMCSLPSFAKMSSDGVKKSGP